MPDLLIQNGHLVDPAAGINAPRDLLISNGQIAAVEPPNTLPTTAAPEHINATGLHILPGLIDLHVHLREPGQTWKETIATGTRAAAFGGITTVVAMPNTTPVTDTVATLQYVLSPDRNPAVRVLAMPAVTVGSLGKHLTDMPALHAAGAVGFTDDGKPVLHDHVMRAALVACARLNVPLSQHSEDARVTSAAPGQKPSSMNAGPLALRLGLRGYPTSAESDIVARDLDLLREIEQTEHLRPHLHVQHISTAAAVGLIREAKQQGLHVTCEAAPHHFLLTEDAVATYDTHAKMYPPLRSAADRDAVLEALLDSTVDCVATDHAPHAAWEKEVEFERSPNGITGLETSFGLTLRTLAAAHGTTAVTNSEALNQVLAQLVTLMGTNPANILRQPNLGTLTAGSPADLLLLNATHPHPYDPTQSPSKSRNTPFPNTPLLGQIHTTFFAGKSVYGSNWKPLLSTNAHGSA